MWLLDFLPSEMKKAKARIMTFGYDADLRSRNVLDMMNFGENLLAGLRTQRRGVVSYMNARYLLVVTDTRTGSRAPHHLRGPQHGRAGDKKT